MGRFIPAIAVLTIVSGSFWSCGNAAPERDGGGQNGAESEPALSPDSLRRVYRQYYEARSDWMPARQHLEAGKLYPVDEALLDTTFFVFREHLRQAVTDRDIFSVMEVVDENIKCSSGGESGLAAFVTAWELESEEKVQSSPLWAVLEKTLAGGGTFAENGNLFIAPYTFSTFPKNVDPSGHAVVTGAGVRLRSAPGLNSQTLTMVSNDIVTRLETSAQTETIDGETHPWVQIRLPDGKEGFIWGKFIAEPGDYHAVFRRSAGQRWTMTTLLTGK